MLQQCRGHERPLFRAHSPDGPIRGKRMKTSKTMIIAAAVVALAACNKKTPVDNQASAVEANASNQAENVSAAGENEAANIMNSAENKASAVKNETKNEAASIKNEGKNEAAAIKNSASNTTENKTK
jgi:predicted small lipoprotein YifL